MRLMLTSLSAAASVLLLAGGASAQQSMGTVSRQNQDMDNRPAEQSMQPVGGRTQRPGLIAQPADPAAQPRKSALVSRTVKVRTSRRKASAPR